MLVLRSTDDSIHYTVTVDGHDIYGYGDPDGIPAGATIITRQEYIAYANVALAEGEQAKAQILADSLVADRAAYDARIAVLVSSGMTSGVAAAIIGARP